MLADLTADQRALAEYMSELSEQAYHAGWMSGLEYALWRALNGGTSAYGQIYLTREHLHTLRRLSDRCGGWIVYETGKAETFIPMDAWKVRYDVWRARRAAASVSKPDVEVVNGVYHLSDSEILVWQASASRL